MKSRRSSIEPMVKKINDYLNLLIRAKRFHEVGSALTTVEKKKMACAQSDLQLLASIYKNIENQEHTSQKFDR